ncbi:MAG: hypothetical protein IT448_08615 [Phycisphaerales bacterium]|nr:hypothetical protein [Phycisphaerales bacterium]
MFTKETAIILAAATAVVTISATGVAWSADTTITTNTVQNGSVFSSQDRLIIAGSSSPLLTLTNQATTSGVKTIIIGTSGGNGSLLINNGSSASGGTDNALLGEKYDGDKIFSGIVYLGLKAGSTGTATITGSGSSLSPTRVTYVGWRGHGELNIEQGASVANSAEAAIALQTGSSGTVTVTGSGSSWNNATYTRVGVYGSGTLHIENGGTVSNGDLGIISVNSTGTGVVSVSGAGSQWINATDLRVGNTSVIGGKGELTIFSGGLVQVGGLTSINDKGSKINLQDGGTLKTGSLDRGGAASRFNWTGGALLITGTSGDIPDVPISGTIGGTGTITNNLTIAGNLAPGGSIGTLTLGGNLTLASGANLLYEFGGNSADLTLGSGGNNVLNVGATGAVHLQGVGLPLDNQVTLFSGFETLNNPTNFDNWSVYLNGHQVASAEFDYSQAGLVIVTVPEPGAAAMAGLVAVALTRWRRKRQPILAV